MTAAVVLTSVTFGYQKGEPIIQEATVNIKEGEFIGIIGPNGGGKTTLLKLIMGFLIPWSGNISVYGQPATKYPNGIAYVPQSFRFDKEFPISVLELVLGGCLSQLSWWGGFSKQDREIGLSALEQVGLADYAKKPFSALSGGQAQRAFIARALAAKPRILILDEPTASVDEKAEAEIYEILQRIRKNTTVLMVTHDIRRVIHDVERVLCVQNRVESVIPSRLCEHFALGLYHFPLMQTGETHFSNKPLKLT